MQEKNIITQSKKEFQSMLSTFSHEIRNPLALITSEMQMLSDSQPQLCFNEHWDNIMENLNYIRDRHFDIWKVHPAAHGYSSDFPNVIPVFVETELWL